MSYILGYTRKESPPKLYGIPAYLVDFDNPNIFRPGWVNGFKNRVKNSTISYNDYARFMSPVEDKTIKKLHYDQDGFSLSSTEFGIQSTDSFKSKSLFSSVWINVLDASLSLIASIAWNSIDELHLVAVNGKLCTHFNYKNTLNTNFPSSEKANIVKDHGIDITEGWHHVALISVEGKYKVLYLDGKRLIFDFSEYNVDSNLMPTDGGTSGLTNVLAVGAYSSANNGARVNIQFSEYYVSEIASDDPLMAAAPAAIEVPKSALVIE